jgi:hypothetical protein
MEVGTMEDRKEDGNLAEPPRSPDLTPHRERPPELDAYLTPRLRAPARVQHNAQNAAKPA